MYVQGDFLATSGKESSATIFKYICPKLCWKKAGRKEGNTYEKREKKRKLKIYNYVNTNVMCTISNNNNNNIYLLQLGCHPVAVVILHVYKT